MNRIDSLLDNNLKLALKSKLCANLKEPLKRFNSCPNHHNLYIYDNFLNDYCIPETSFTEFDPRYHDKSYLMIRSIQDKDWAYHLISQGLEYAQSKDYEKAIVEYELALSIDTDNIEALMARGISLANTKKFTLAIKDFSRVLEINPNHRIAKTNLIKTKTAHDMIIAERQSATNGEFLLPTNYDPWNPLIFEKSLDLSNDLFP